MSVADEAAVVAGAATVVVVGATVVVVVFATVVVVVAGVRRFVRFGTVVVVVDVVVVTGARWKVWTFAVTVEGECGATVTFGVVTVFRTEAVRAATCFVFTGVRCLVSADVRNGAAWTSSWVVGACGATALEAGAGLSCSVVPRTAPAAASSPTAPASFGCRSLRSPGKFVREGVPGRAEDRRSCEEIFTAW